MSFDTNMFLRGYNPVPIESRANALMRGLEVRNQQQGNALNALKLQAAQQQMAEQAQQRNALEAFKGSIVSPQMQASQAALAGGGGPTLANAARMPKVDPRTQMLYGAMQAGQITPMDYLNAAMPAPIKPERKVVGDAYIEAGPNGVRELYKADKGPKLPPGMQMGPNGPEWIPGYLEGRGQVARAGASSISYGSPLSAINPATGQTELVRPDNQGGMKFTGVKPAGDSDKPLTEGQAKAVVYASRMLSADQTLAELNRKGVFASVPGSRLPGVGGVVNAMSPADQQRLDQAKRDFINAVLRRESGAVIADSEFENADKQYFPQIGDSREVREQKARNRRVAIEGIRADVPKSKQGEVDRISGAGAPAAADDSDPLGLRRK